MSEGQAKSHFDKGLEVLDRFRSGDDASALPEASKAFQVAVEEDPSDAASWMAFGYCRDLVGDLPDALAAFRTAERLVPSRLDVGVMVLRLLVDLGETREAVAGARSLAARHGIDLDAVERELKDVGLPVDAPTLIGNAFPSARNLIRSWIEVEIDSAERRSGAVDAGRDDDTALRHCLDEQQAIASTWEVLSIPEPLRVLFPWVKRLGIGDDPCRTLVLGSLGEADRVAVRAAVEPLATLIHAWLDEVGGEAMSPEAAAFMYLLLGIEESTPET